MTRIAVVGDYQPDNATHVGTNLAFAGWLDVEVTWVPTPDVAGRASEALAGFDGLLVAPGSPYRSMQGALEAIRYAREDDVPLLGTCGGFQHIVIEFARNVLGVVDAEHAESHPHAPTLFITPLSCSLAGLEMSVTLTPSSVVARAYDRLESRERYYCNFGLNPDCRAPLEKAGLAVTGVDQGGEVRVMELSQLRFFVGTLFVPQASSGPGQPHPLVTALVEAARRG